MVAADIRGFLPVVAGPFRGDVAAILLATVMVHTAISKYIPSIGIFIQVSVSGSCADTRSPGERTHWRSKWE